MKFKAFQYTSQEDPLESGMKTSTRFPSNAYGRAVWLDEQRNKDKDLDSGELMTEREITFLCFRMWVWRSMGLVKV